jgi:hypothetical protein
MALSDFYKVVLTSVIQSWYNKNVTRLITQGCNNIVISWLYRTCWNNLVTRQIISTRLLQVVNSLFQTCWQLRTSSANISLLADLLQDVRFLRVSLWEGGLQIHYDVIILKINGMESCVRARISHFRTIGFQIASELKLIFVRRKYNEK